jgi:hypothetical protein
MKRVELMLNWKDNLFGFELNEPLFSRWGKRRRKGLHKKIPHNNARDFYED